MIQIDGGKAIAELLTRAEQLGDRSRLDVAVPFVDTDSNLFELLIGAVSSGARVRFITRPPHDASRSEILVTLSDQGVRVVQLPRIHAKLFILSDRYQRHSMGWIGSHNFTKASERTAQELGVVFSGNSVAGARLIQQALLQLDAWESDGRKSRKSA